MNNKTLSTTEKTDMKIEMTKMFANIKLEKVDGQFAVRIRVYNDNEEE